MVTLSKRATPSQQRILRIIEGAVLNAADAHQIKRDERMARSIAKRAAGTLSSQWPDVLAANMRPSVSGSSGDFQCRACERREHLTAIRARRERVKQRTYDAKADSLITAAQGGGLLPPNKQPPLLELWRRLKREMWHISRSDDQSKYLAYVDLLRMIDKLHRDLIAADDCH